MFRKPRKRPDRRFLPDPIDRAACSARAVALFNTGAFWEAHEALETIWRSIRDEEEALVVQGLIQAAAALLHLERGNMHGVRVVGGAAGEKLAGCQHPAVEFETERFGRALAAALQRDGPIPMLALR